MMRRDYGHRRDAKGDTVSRELSKLTDEYVETEWMAIVERFEPEAAKPSWGQRLLELFGRTAICWAVPTVPPPYQA